MSLGIRTIWRARAISPAGSLIPREPVASSSLSARPVVLNNKIPPWRLACMASSTRSVSLAADTAPEAPASSTTPSTIPPAPATVPNLATFAQRLALIPVRPHDADSILVRSRMEYPNRRETRYNEHMRHREMLAQKLHEKLARANHEPMPNWRSVLQSLVAMTPRHMNGIVKVFMPKDASIRLLDPARDDNLWAIGFRTRCHMVLEPETDPDGNQVLKISGTRTAVEQAIDDIVHIAKSVKVMIVPPDTGGNIIYDGLVGEVEPGAQIVISRGPPAPSNKLPPQPRLDTKVRDLPKPPEWTKRNFQEYVATLARGYLPTWGAHDLYPGRRITHQSEVLKLLVDAFYDPSAREALSVTAFKEGLRYTARCGRRARAEGRLLFDRMEKLSMPTDTTVFNLLLESTIYDRDLRSFSYCVFLMGRRGLQPNLRTWLLFLRLIQSEEVRRYVLQAIIHKNLLVFPGNMAQVAYEMAPYDTERGVLQCLSIQALLAAESNLYGDEWMDSVWATPICNKMIRVLAKHSKWDQVNELIDFMATRPSPNIFPNELTLRICVEHLKEQSYMRNAIDLVIRFEALGKEASTGTLRALFVGFSQHNMVHSMDAVWQYSLLTGRTSSDAAYRIRNLLKTQAKATGRHPLTDVIPTQLDKLPGTKKQAKQYALYALILGSARDVFGIERPATTRDLLRRQHKRGIAMRDRGCMVPAGTLGRTLLEAAQKDLRFHKNLGKKKWIIEPTVLPTEWEDADGRELSERVALEENDDDVEHETPGDEDEDEDEASNEPEEDGQDIEL